MRGHPKSPAELSRNSGGVMGQREGNRQTKVTTHDKTEKEGELAGFKTKAREVLAEKNACFPR